jgi:hypothetical protein
MSEIGSLGITEVLIISCACLIPIVLAAAVVIVLLVFVRRGKPETAPQKAPTRKPAPSSASEPAAAPKEDPIPRSEPVTMSDLTTKSCSSCGADNPEDNAFCEYCGASLAEE